MSLKEEEVRGVANLARLALSDDEVALFSNQLSKVLDHIGALARLDTSAVVPTSHVLDLHNVFREDKVDEKRFAPDAWQKNAPSQEHGHFRVPKVIDG